MSIKLVNTKCTCQFCYCDYMTDDFDAWSPFLYCCGECEALDESSEDEENDYDM